MRPDLSVEGLEGRKLLSSLNVSRFPVPTGQVTQLDRIVTGPDGNLWFTGNPGDGVVGDTFTTGEIGRITPGGRITVFPLPKGDAPNGGLTAGPDGNVWFVSSNGIARITTSGVLTEFKVPVGTNPMGLTGGPDGNLWFTDQGLGKVGRITPKGVVTEFPIPDGSLPGVPEIGSALLSQTLTTGADGNLWFMTHFSDPPTGNLTGAIERMTPTGAVKGFKLPSGWTADSITTGLDGNVWFTESRDAGSVFKFGKITPAGKITEFKMPAVLKGEVSLSITAGTGTSLWFNLADNNFDVGPNPLGTVGSITTRGKVHLFALPHAFQGATSLTTGPDGNLWFTDVSNPFDNGTPVALGRFKPKG
jgi:streptogramin lyase